MGDVMPWENPMEREHLCPECKDEVRIETFDASGVLPGRRMGRV